MKKNFPLQAPGKADARVHDKIKHEVNKYVARERRKPLPEGADLWEFHCRVGAAAETAESTPLPDVSHAIDRVAQTGVKQVFIEILATPAQRRARRGPR